MKCPLGNRKERSSKQLLLLGLCDTSTAELEKPDLNLIRKREDIAAFFSLSTQLQGLRSGPISRFLKHWDGRINKASSLKVETFVLCCSCPWFPHNNPKPRTGAKRSHLIKCPSYIVKAVQSSFNVYWQSAFAGDSQTDKKRRVLPQKAKDRGREEYETSRVKEALIHQLAFGLSTEDRPIAILAY